MQVSVDAGERAHNAGERAGEHAGERAGERAGAEGTTAVTINSKNYLLHKLPDICPDALNSIIGLLFLSVILCVFVVTPLPGKLGS
jgi:hypothetical protein